MSTHEPTAGQRPEGQAKPADGAGPPSPWMPPNASTTPNAERYLLEADALRRRQLRSALLHGSGRTWRDNRRIWPGVVAGIVVVAVILAVFAVIKAINNNSPEDAAGAAAVCGERGGCDVRSHEVLFVCRVCLAESSSWH